MSSNRRSEQVWQLSEATVVGKAHVDNALPNQDAVQVATNASGDVVCAVVSDGAGTAARSDEGSRTLVGHIAPRMCEFGRRFRDGPLQVDAIREELEVQISLVRSRLDPQQSDLRDFHCTFVMWLATPMGGVFAQVGDSAALATRFAWVNAASGQQADFFPDGAYRLYEVERGEYSNETHFITEADWKSHLRIHLIPPEADAVVLMTDGAMDIAMLKGQVFRGFLSNLVGKLIATPDLAERQSIIGAWLADRQTFAVTGDDKTLFVAIRQQRRAFAGKPVFVDQVAGGGAASGSTKVTTGEAPSAGSRPSGATPLLSQPARLPAPALPPRPMLDGLSTAQLLMAVIALQFIVIVALAAHIMLREAPVRPDPPAGRAEAAPTDSAPARPAPSPPVAHKPASGTPIATVELPASSTPPADPVIAPEPHAAAVATVEAVTPRADTRIADTSAAIRLQAHPASPALGPDGVGEVELRWLQGQPLSLKKIDFDPRAVKLLEDGTNCKRGETVLDLAGSVCVLRVRAAGATKPVRIELKFVDPAGRTVIQPILFAPHGGIKP